MRRKSPAREELDMARMTSDQPCLIAIGANMPSAAGDPAATVAAALAHLSGEGCAVTAVSHYYRTPAFPPGSGPDFVNAAAVLRWRRGPRPCWRVCTPPRTPSRGGAAHGGVR